MNPVELAFLMCGCCLLVCLWLRIRDLQHEIDCDHRYFEWWMRSLEARKEDKPDVEREAVEEDGFEESDEDDG